MDLAAIKTKGGKKMTDFKIPEKLLKNDPQLVELILRSESMNDDERQYWFNLTNVMTPEQIEKLRDILVRERKKLDEIEKKYGKKKEDPAVVAARAKKLAADRAKKRAEIAAREKAAREKTGEAENILGELDNI